MSVSKEVSKRMQVVMTYPVGQNVSSAPPPLRVEQFHVVQASGRKWQSGTLMMDSVYNVRNDYARIQRVTYGFQCLSLVCLE